MSERPGSFENEQSYLEWVYSSESGLNKVSSTEVLEFQLIYLPLQLKGIKCPTIDNELSVCPVQFQFIVKPINDYTNLLEFGLKTEEDYKNRVDLIEFKHSEFFFAVFGKDTLMPDFTHYENFRGIKNEFLFHLHFKVNQPLKDNLQIIFKDYIFFSGNHTFEYYKKDLNNLPNLIKENHE